MVASSSTAAALALLLAPLLAHGCIVEYGSRIELKERAGVHFSYAYHGLNWPNEVQKCGGSRQSPIMLPGRNSAAANALGAPDAKASFSFGTLTNARVQNNGHTLQVSLPEGFWSDVQVPIKGDKAKAGVTSILNAQGPVTGRVKATPAQLHFHTHGEHVIGGTAYPLELHIVSFVKKDQLPACGDKGCPIVVGVPIALTDNDAEVSPELRRLIEAMPLNEQESAVVSGTIDVSKLLPADRAYYQYEGSLTTPPCTEGLLWTVFATPLKVTQALLTRYQEAVGDSMCGQGPELEAEGARTPTGSGPLTEFLPPPADSAGCVKLANGHNFRVAQPVNGRPVKLAV